MTPRKEEVPREKPWLWRRTAMISSSSEMLPMQSVRSAYLAHAQGTPGQQPSARPEAHTLACMHQQDAHGHLQCPNMSNQATCLSLVHRLCLQGLRLFSI